MARHVIHPLRVAQVELFKATQTYYVDFDVKIAVPIFVWLIQAPTQTILVDAGWIKPEVLKTESKGSGRQPIKIWGGGPEPIVSALGKFAVSPSQIDTLILTHLHRDHCSNVSLFKNANVYVRKEELTHALDPIPNQIGMYSKETIRAISELSNLELVTRDKEIVPGVKIMKASGHTPGLQAVLVETDKGTAVICSDAVPLYHNWFPNDPRYGNVQPQFRHIPPGIIYDLKDCYATMEKIETVGDIIIPSHDSIISAIEEIPE